MKHEFSYSSGEFNFEIKSHAGFFYLFKNDRKIARSDDQQKLRAYIDGFSKGFEDGEEKERNIIHQYRHEESHLEEMKRDRLKLLEQDTEKQIKEIEDKTADCNKNINLVHRIKYLLETKNKKLDFDASKIEGSRNLIDTYEDENMIIHAYIFKNNRPVNQYTLCVVGYSRIGNSRYHALGKTILELPNNYIYGLSLYGSGHNIEQEINYFPSELEAIEYANRIKITGMLQKFFREYKKVKIEFDKVNEFYNLEDFKNIQLPKEDW